MKKKIAADLTSLAHRILQMKNKEDIHELQSVAKELYEKLTILSFTEKHFGDVQPTAGTVEVQEKIEEAFTAAQEDVESVTQEVEQAMENAKSNAEDAFSNPDLSDLFVPADQDMREEIELPGISTIHKMVDEFPEEEIEIDFPKPTYEKNDMEDLTAGYEKMPEFERKINNQSEKGQSINDRLKAGLKIGMNDRIGFIKHLFNGSDQDYNRVLSQLNTMESKIAAQNFIISMVKPDYNNWEGKDAYVERFMQIVEAKFDN
ncbi:hypothetical protein [Nonlabens ulvanivorans]|uniref:hypothetical protein n=1 Tax=Nonlabens ulvanivorans TaxID=906888 RepID=UPI002942429D|nr:hypothetical protein [Nonlabens ulvanivorans]WOI22305.1 hypothetical protein R1T42_11580 [Nonlabens ulvanivorans]